MPSDTHTVISEIANQLFSAEERRLEGVREQLISSNKECYRDRPHDGFNYKGQVYDPANLQRGPRTRVTLHLSLVDQMEEWLADKEKVWSDRYTISQMLFTLLSPCQGRQDIRDALPNCVVDTLEGLKGIIRLKDEAHTIIDNPRTYRQYLKIRPRMEFYATARLLY